MLSSTSLEYWRACVCNSNLLGDLAEFESLESVAQPLLEAIDPSVDPTILTKEEWLESRQRNMNTELTEQ